MTRLRHVLALLAVLLAEVGAVAVLHALGEVQGLAGPLPQPGGWQDWLRTTPPEDALAAVARLLALALALWLLVSTLLAVLARVLRWRPLQLMTSLLAARSVRRMVDRGLAGMVAMTVAIGPAAPAAAASYPGGPAAAVVDPAAVSSEPGGPATVVVDPVRLLPPLWQPASRSPHPVDHAAPQPPLPPAPQASTAHVVRAGEHLWLLAERLVRARTSAASTAAVAVYWRRVVAANRAALRSGDPDLVYPGERILLPPLGGPAAPSQDHARGA